VKLLGGAEVTDRTCWGIFRERAHSPGRECDDAEILNLTGKELEARGFGVTLKSPEELAWPLDTSPRFVFLMCERVEALRVLQSWEVRGVRHVNSPQAVLNTYRERMITQFEEAGVPFIQSRVIETVGEAAGETAGRDGGGPLPVWVKRADVHNTQEGDVVFAETADAVRDALGTLAARGIPRGILQPHVEGDLIKFYGVGTGRGRAGGPPWFRWFYHKDQRVAGHPLDPSSLGRLVRRAAAALGLEVYGGDAIASPSGELVLLDLNAWPSFALYREEAAVAIAAYLVSRFREVVR